MIARHAFTPRRCLCQRRLSRTHELMVRVAWPVRLDRMTNVRPTTTGRSNA